MSVDTFDYDSGALCLDFANTVAWHASDEPRDRLHGYGDLIRWGEGAGLLSAVEAQRLAQAAEEHPEAAQAVFAAAVELREALYRIFAGVAAGKSVDPADLERLNRHLSWALPHRKIVPALPAFTWVWQAEPGDLEQIVWPVVRSAADLLTGDTLERVGQCADDRGCGYLFVDTSRNRSRRWCSMESCGNRAKVRRHYRRQQDRDLGDNGGSRG